jgi:hypothetical protein
MIIVVKQRLAYGRALCVHRKSLSRHNHMQSGSIEASPTRPQRISFMYSNSLVALRIKQVGLASFRPLFCLARLEKKNVARQKEGKVNGARSLAQDFHATQDSKS